MSQINQLLNAQVEGEQVVIRIGLNALKWAAENCPLFRNPEKHDECGPYEKVVDTQELAQDVVNELMAEEEDGTTPLHVLFDKAFVAACENGSLAFADEEEAQ